MVKKYVAYNRMFYRRKSIGKPFSLGKRFKTAKAARISANRDNRTWNRRMGRKKGYRTELAKIKAVKR